MTTRERIIALLDGGHEPHMIAALLGLDVTDVALTIADSSHTPEDPSGGSSGPQMAVDYKFLVPGYQAVCMNPSDADHIYWTAGTHIAQATIDGSGSNLLTAALEHTINCLAFGYGHFYFTYASGITHFLGRCNSEGGEVEEEWVEFSGHIYGVCAPPIGGKLYVAEGANKRIVRIDHETGEGLEEVAEVEGEPDSVAVSETHVYWGDESAEPRTIGRCGIEGEEVEPHFCDVAGEPDGVVVDQTHVYWADPNAKAIGRVELDGSNPEPLWLPLPDVPEQVRGVLPTRQALFFVAGGIGKATPLASVTSAF